MGKTKELIGGQAVMEGVMMKGPKSISVSVRKKDKTIVSKKEDLPKHNILAKTFFFRGVYNIIEMLVIGIKALIWSSNQLLEEEEQEEFGKRDIALLLIVSFGFAILLFVALPYFLTHFIGFDEIKNPVFFNLIDGIIKIGIFFIYLISISLMPDVKRLFEYHGAEHKTVHCYEAGKKLTVENVREYTTLHPRCGTSFIIIVLVISIFIFAFLPQLTLIIYPGFVGINIWLQKAVLFPLRILFIPVVAGVSYEILRLSAKYDNNPIFHIMVIPGLLVQKITTSEPDDSQIEVAIDAMKKVM